MNERSIPIVRAYGFLQAPFEQLVDLAIDERFDRLRRLITLEDRGDVFRQTKLQRRNCIQHGRARAARQGFDERRISRRQQFARVRSHETFDLIGEEPGLK